MRLDDRIPCTTVITRACVCPATIRIDGPESSWRAHAEDLAVTGGVSPPVLESHTPTCATTITKSPRSRLRQIRLMACALPEARPDVRDAVLVGVSCRQPITAIFTPLFGHELFRPRRARYRSQRIRSEHPIALGSDWATPWSSDQERREDRRGSPDDDGTPTSTASRNIRVSAFGDAPQAIKRYLPEARPRPTS